MKILPDGFVENFSYDANGNLVETRNANGNIKRQFDVEDRLIEESQGNSQSKIPTTRTVIALLAKRVW